MKKTSPKELIKRIKDKAKSEEKANYTFRFTSTLMVDFKTKCEKNEVSMASILEEMIRDFVTPE